MRRFDGELSAELQEGMLKRGIDLCFEETPLKIEGKKGDLNNRKNIIEAFKFKDINSRENKKLKFNTYYDKNDKFRKLY